jgi:hypothetical protein
MDERRSDLVLSTRLAMLRDNLMTVGKAIDELEKARQTESLMPASEIPLRKLADAVGLAVDKLRELLRTTSVEVQAQAEQILNAVTKEKFAALVATKTPSRHLLALKNTSVGRALGDRATDLSDDLDDIEEMVATAHGKPPGEADEQMKKAWDRYRKALVSCHEIFVEYVDVIQGVLLRDAGIDRDLCRIADELIKTWYFADHSWLSFSIPADYERRSMSTAELIRLGFPEWSVWSLPLVAGEFGHVFATRHERIKKDVTNAREALVADDEELRSWAADIFATSVMGSAYPWAAMLLRTDPSNARDQTRVAVMLYTLTLLNAPTDYYGPLAVAWHGTTEQVELPPKQKEFVNTVMKRIKREFRRWEQTNDIVDKLHRESSPGDIASPLQLTDLPNIFVAAWRERIRMANVIEVEGDPQETGEQRANRRRKYATDLEHLAERTRATCIVVIDRPGSGVGGALPEALQLPAVSSPPSTVDFGPGKSPADQGANL